VKKNDIKQKVSFNASAHDVYEALMDSKKHAKFTGGPAKISRKIGGKFSVYDGYAAGKNLELMPDEKIVQTWRASDWDEEDISEISFTFTPTKTGCTVIFTQKNVPSKHLSAIKQGWIDYYWMPMKKMLEIR
jgi:activator of HSP90 ATPase